MTIEKLVELLRKMRGSFFIIAEMATEHECDCPLEWARCHSCRIKQRAMQSQREITEGIDSALADPDRLTARGLAERVDSSAPVAEPDIEWWEDKTFRAKWGPNVLHVQSVGPRHWHWYVGFTQRLMPNGLTARAEGTASSFEEAKKAASDAAKERT